MKNLREVAEAREILSGEMDGACGAAARDARDVLEELGTVLPLMGRLPGPDPVKPSSRTATAKTGAKSATPAAKKKVSEKSRHVATISEEVPTAAVTLDIPADVGARIRAVREGAGMKVEAVAKAVPMSAGYYSQIEGGKNRPRTKMLARIAAALGTTPEKIVAAAPSATKPKKHAKAR
jgi:ribosome-binding protein aMBF1 (putative translation factor)